MVCRYIDDGKLYVASVCGVDIAVFLVTDHSPETVEIKNIAVIPSRQRMGYRREFLYWIHHRYGGRKIIVGTGEVPSTLDFYRSCGYTYSHRISPTTTTTLSLRTVWLSKTWYTSPVQPTIATNSPITTETTVFTARYQKQKRFKVCYKVNSARNGLE